MLEIQGIDGQGVNQRIAVANPVTSTRNQQTIFMHESTLCGGFTTDLWWLFCFDSGDAKHRAVDAVAECPSVCLYVRLSVGHNLLVSKWINLSSIISPFDIPTPTVWFCPN